jgi:hypothetical protein
MTIQCICGVIINKEDGYYAIRGGLCKKCFDQHCSSLKQDLQKALANEDITWTCCGGVPITRNGKCRTCGSRFED